MAAKRRLCGRQIRDRTHELTDFASVEDQRRRRRGLRMDSCGRAQGTLPRINNTAPGAELGRDERLHRAGSLLTISAGTEQMITDSVTAVAFRGIVEVRRSHRIGCGMGAPRRCLPVMPPPIASMPGARHPRRRYLPIALLLALLATNATAATIAVDVASHAGTINIEASALLNADARTAWDVLTDYDHYTDFIPGLRASHIVGRRGATVTV